MLCGGSKPRTRCALRQTRLQRLTRVLEHSGMIPDVPVLCGPEFASRVSLKRLQAEDAADEDMAAAMASKESGVGFWRDSKFAEAAAEFEKAVERLPQIAAARQERINCLNNWAACMIKLDEPLKAAALCTRTLELEPNNKKARLRRALAYEALALPAKAGADAVVLLSQEASLNQAKECLGRCLKASSTLRTDVVQELTAVLALLDAKEGDKQSDRMKAAHVLAGTYCHRHDSMGTYLITRCRGDLYTLTAEQLALALNRLPLCHRERLCRLNGAEPNALTDGRGPGSRAKAPRRSCGGGSGGGGSGGGECGGGGGGSG